MAHFGAEPVGAPIRLRLLGGLQLTRPDGTPLNSILAQPKRVALLTYLALAPGGPFHRRDVLLPLFWPEFDQDRARAALRRALHFLRQSLGVGVLVGRGDEDVGLNADGFWCDAAEFRSAADAGRLDEALTLYRHDLLPGFFVPDAAQFEEWLDAERARLRSLAARACVLLSERLEASDAPAEAIERAREATVLDPTAEPLVRRLVGLLVRAGDRAGAVHAWETWTRRLEQDYGLKPGPETRQLVDRWFAENDPANDHHAAGRGEPAPPMSTPVLADGPVNEQVRQKDEAPQASETRSALRPSILRAAPRSLPLAAGVALVAAVVLLGFNVRGLWERSSGTAARRIESIAVLPFSATSPGSGDPLLELGLAETLITRLSANSSLRVRSLASAQRFAGPQRDAIDAGRQLGAAYVVEGSTQRHGDRVRVNARLLTVPDGTTVWADTFDEAIDSVFTLQDAIAGAVTAGLTPRADAMPARDRSPCEGADAEAYRALLTGRYLTMRPSAARLLDAIAAFRRAIDLDPSCARAYAGLAWAHRGQMIAGDGDPREFVSLAMAAAEQAIAIDPSSAEAYTSRGFIEFWHNWDWTAAETSFRRAIALDPSSANAHYAYAHLLVNLARFDAGLDQMRQARELDPLSPLINTLEAGFLSAANRPDAARQGLERVLVLEPDFWVALFVRGGLALDRGELRSAIADLSRAGELSGESSPVLALLAMAYAAAGDRDMAQAILGGLEARARAGYVPATSLAAAHLSLGDAERALDLLERAYSERAVHLAFLKIDARWNDLRAEPRFKALSRRLGLEADWAHGRF